MPTRPAHRTSLTWCSTAVGLWCELPGLTTSRVTLVDYYIWLAVFGFIIRKYQMYLVDERQRTAFGAGGDVFFNSVCKELRRHDLPSTLSLGERKWVYGELNCANLRRK